MMRLYNAALLPFRLGLAAWGAFRTGTTGGDDVWSERLARRVPIVPPGGVWIHGSSVGEARIVAELAREIRAVRPSVPIAVSALTTTGRGQLPAPPAIDAAFLLPLDFSGLPSRILEGIRPRMLVIVETELWPNLFRETLDAGVTIVIVNGRLSAGKMTSYRRLARLFRPLLSEVRAVGVRSEDDARRFGELGVPSSVIRVTGNVKYDLPRPEIDPDRLRRRLGLEPGRPVFVAGSTAKGEDALVLEAFALVRQRHPDACLVLAPRHPERCEDVEQLVTGSGHRLGRISSSDRPSSVDVLLVDTIGHLQGLYSLGAAAFVGGSLVPRGGHNVLEPALVGVPVLFGPHTESVREPADALVDAGAAIRVRSARELGEAVCSILDDPARGEALTEHADAVLESNRGALRRSRKIVLEALDSIARESCEGDS